MRIILQDRHVLDEFHYSAVTSAPQATERWNSSKAQLLSQAKKGGKQELDIEQEASRTTAILQHGRRQREINTEFYD